MPDDSGPLIIAAVALLVLGAPVALIARSTAARLVRNEHAPQARAAYAKHRTSTERQQLLDRRSERFTRAHQARRVYQCVVTGIVAVFAMYGLMLATRTKPNDAAVIGLVALTIAAPVATYLLLRRRQVTFPDVPSMNEAPEPTVHVRPGGENNEHSRDPGAGTVTTKPQRTHAIVAPADKKSRRKKTAASRKLNRRR